MNSSQDQAPSRAPNVFAHWLGRREDLWVLIFFVLLTIVITWPVLNRLDTYIIGGESDAYLHLWNFHWVEDSFLRADGVRPWLGGVRLWTDRLFFPVGVSSAYQNIAWLHALVWAALRPLIGGFPAYSLVVLLFFVLNGWAGYRFVRDITGSVPAALLGGIVLLMWPATVDHSNQPNITTSGLVVMCMLHIRRLARRAALSDVLKLAGWGALLAVSRIQMVVLGAFVLIPYWLLCLTRLERKRIPGFVLRCAAAGLLAAIVSLPFTLPYVELHVLSGGTSDGLQVGFNSDEASNAVFYLLPRIGGVLAGEWVQRSTGSLGLLFPVYSSSIGVTTLALSAVATLRRRKDTLFWTGLVVLIFVLALGPEPRIVGLTLRWRPYVRAYLEAVVPLIREPRRFDVILSIPLSVLAAWGLVTIRHEPVLRKLGRAGAALAISLVIVEFLRLPHPTLPVNRVPAWYRSRADDEEDYGLLKIPMFRQWDETYMLYQLYHHKGLVHGHVSRVPASAYDFIDSVPLTWHLRHVVSDEPPEGDADVGLSLDLLHDARVRYIVIHRLFTTEDKVAVWRAWFPLTPYHEDQDVIVYRTDWRQQMAEIRSAPALTSGLRLPDLHLKPETTIPSGWLEVSAGWYLHVDADTGLCLMMLDGKDRVMVEDCTRRPGAFSSRRRATDTLLRTRHLIQVPHDAAPGTYRLCFRPSEAAISAPDLAQLVCSQFTVAARVRHFDPLPVEYPVGVGFGEQLRLIGFDLLSDGPDHLRLRLVWHALRRAEVSYKVFVHVIDAESREIAAQLDFVPRDWRYPTSEWQAEEYVDDVVSVDVGHLDPGTYEVYVGLYDPETRRRLSTDPALPDDAAFLVSLKR